MLDVNPDDKWTFHKLKEFTDVNLLVIQMKDIEVQIIWNSIADNNESA